MRDAEEMRCALREIETRVCDALASQTNDEEENRRTLAKALDGIRCVVAVEARWTVGAEYEYAYCSNCGHAEWAAWDSTEEAKDCVTDFCNDVKFCPNCGAKMKGGAQ